MSKQNCPHCGHLVTDHCNPTETNIPGCLKVTQLENYYPTQTKCPCTRTYESLVGENIINYWHPFEGGLGYETPCTRCGVRFAEHQDLPKRPETAKDEPIGENADCPCFHWEWRTDAIAGHHPSCDRSSKSELQLLVIDLGDSCVVKVEKGEWQRDGICQYQGSVTITLPLNRLRDELDGERPVPRIERSGTTEESYEIINVHGDGAGVIYSTAYDALSELAGKPLPIYEGGAWEDLQPKTGIGWEMPVGIYRYTKENK